MEKDKIMQEFFYQKVYLPIYHRVKEVFEIVFALLLLLLSLPLLLIIALVIKLTSKGPIFYRQERLGFAGKSIYVYKFRTMRQDAEKILARWLKNNPQLKAEFQKHYKLRNDPRITRVGRILRRTSLDELPQVFNVLKGEMALIGPRPIIKEEISCYGKDIERLFSVKPGLTGLWQVSGRNAIPYEDRVRLDLEYIDRRCFLLDLNIFFRTFKAVFTGHGAY